MDYSFYASMRLIKDKVKFWMKMNYLVQIQLEETTEKD